MLRVGSRNRCIVLERERVIGRREALLVDIIGYYNSINCCGPALGHIMLLVLRPKMGQLFYQGDI